MCEKGNTTQKLDMHRRTSNIHKEKDVDQDNSEDPDFCILDDDCFGSAEGPIRSYPHISSAPLSLRYKYCYKGFSGT